jgi:hypothetical protein
MSLKDVTAAGNRAHAASEAHRKAVASTFEAPAMTWRSKLGLNISTGPRWSRTVAGKPSRRLHEREHHVWVLGMIR